MPRNIKIKTEPIYQNICPQLEIEKIIGPFKNKTQLTNTGKMIEEQYNKCIELSTS